MACLPVNHSLANERGAVAARRRARGPVLGADDLEPRVGQPADVVRKGGERPAVKRVADRLHLRAEFRPISVFRRQPCRDHHPAARCDSRSGTLAERPFVDEVLGALDAPQHVERCRWERHRLGVDLLKPRPPRHPGQACRPGGPAALHATEGDPVTSQLTIRVRRMAEPPCHTRRRALRARACCR
jgi:hypothetical protein